MIKSLTLLFKLAAWPENTDKRLPTISFVMFSVSVLSLLQSILISCQDSEAAKRLSDSARGTHQGEEGVQLNLNCMQCTILTNDCKINMLGISLRR